MCRVTFDLDVLRTFVTGMELGSFARAAERLGRSTSAVSAQLKKLEEQADTSIFRKAGRGLSLTEAGETMLGYARRLIELNDGAALADGVLQPQPWRHMGGGGGWPRADDPHRHRPARECPGARARNARAAVAAEDGAAPASEECRARAGRGAAGRHPAPIGVRGV